MLRDTVIAGEAAVIIGVHGQGSFVASSRTEATAVTSHLTLAGEENGEAVFGSASGLMLSRTRSGRMAGEVRVVGRSGTVSAPQMFDYTGAITLVR